MDAKNNFTAGNAERAEFWPPAFSGVGLAVDAPAQLKDRLRGSHNPVARTSNFQSQLHGAFEAIAEPLSAVEELLKVSLSAQPELIANILAHVASLSGKRLRPALLLLSAKASGGINEEAVRLAAVVELVHTATLVHDDILDSANFRRHKQTIHSKWDVPNAILIGDWLFTQAYSMANAGESTLPGRWIALAAKSVCEGEILQNTWAGNSLLSQKQYIQILAGKTGTLCAVSCGLGAWVGGADLSQCERFYQFGMNLGIGFQIYDDWLDIWGSEEQIGKSNNVDMRDKKWTLPLLRFRDTAVVKDQRMLLDLMGQHEVDAHAIRNLLDQSDANDFTCESARGYINKAKAEIKFLSGSPEFEMLEHLADAAVHRSK
jgi:octaprenyl-diphosphate synthase